MKTIAILHKPRFWAIVVLTLPLVPVLAIMLQVFTSPTMDDFSRLDRFAQKRWESQFGPNITPQLIELDRQLLTKLSSGDYERFVEFMGIQSDTLSATYVDATTVSGCVESKFGDLITSYAAVSRSGGAQRSVGYRELVTTCPEAMLLAGCLISACAAESGDWGKAITRAEEAAHVYDGYRALGESAQNEAAKARSLVYSLYRLMLNRRPNAGVARRLIKSLQSLQESDPSYKEMPPSLGMAGWNDDSVKEIKKEYGRVRGTLLVAFLNRVFGANMRMLNSAVEGVASDQTDRMGNETQFQVGLPTPRRSLGFFEDYLFPWTSTYAQKAFLRRSVKPDPDYAKLQATLSKADFSKIPKSQSARLVELRHWKPAIDAGFDPALIMMYTYFQYNSDDFARVARTRFIRTQNLLLQTAFGARAFHEEHDRWPTTIGGEIMPDYVPYPAGDAVVGRFFDLRTASEPLRQFRVEWTRVTENVIDLMFPIRATTSWTESQQTSLRKPDRGISPHVILSKAEEGYVHAQINFHLVEGSRHFIRAARWARALQTQAADLGASVTVMITNPTDSNSTGGTSSYFWSAEQALAIADGEYFEVGLFCGGTGKSAARRLSDSTSDFIAELKLPEKVIAINAMGGNLDYVVEGEGKQNLDQIWSNNEPLPIFRRVVEFPEGW